MDYLLYKTPESKTFSNRVAKHVISKSNANGWSNLDTGCLVNSVFNDWTNNDFIFGPVFCSLTVDSGEAQHATVLEKAAERISSRTISNYFSGSWIAISTITMNGDIESSAALLRGMRGTGSSQARSGAGGTASSSSNDTFPTWAIALVTVVGALLLITGIIVVIVLVRRKGRVSAYHQPLLEEEMK